jgi:hypothetical protein
LFRINYNSLTGTWFGVRRRLIRIIVAATMNISRQSLFKGLNQLINLVTTFLLLLLPLKVEKESSA